MDLTLFVGPLLALTTVFSLAVVNDPQTVYIDRITVPKHLEERGYLPSVIETRLIDYMRRMERDAMSRAELRKMTAETEPTTLKLISDYFSITPLIRVVQNSLGYLSYTFDGEIVQDQHSLEIVLRGRHTDGRQLLIVETGGIEDPDVVIRAAAFQAMNLVDPYIRAAYQFKVDLATRDFTKTKELIRYHLKNPPERYHLWLHNLEGIVRYVEGDRQGAMEAFATTVRTEPDFSLALVNWGVVLAQEGRHEDAIAKYRQVFRRDLPTDAPQTFAAAYSEWGMSAAALGRYDEAFALFAAAEKADPKFADVYFNRAEILRRRGRQTEADAMTRRGNEIEPESAIYTENLLGVLQDMGARKRN